MSAVEIVPVRGRADLDHFIRLPAEIAVGDPMFVPPLALELAMRRIIESLGAVAYKTYRAYEKTLT